MGDPCTYAQNLFDRVLRPRDDEAGCGSNPPQKYNSIATVPRKEVGKMGQSRTFRSLHPYKASGSQANYVLARAHVTAPYLPGT